MAKLINFAVIAFLLCACAPSGDMAKKAKLSNIDQHAYIGMPAAEWLEIFGPAYRVYKTVVKGAVHHQLIYRQYFRTHDSPEWYIYFENGKLTAWQRN